MSVTTNAAQTAARLRKIAERVEERAVDGLRAIAGATYREAGLGTPVDTGRARANWRVTVAGETFDVIGISTGPRAAQESAASQAESQSQREASSALAALRPGDRLFVQNNLPYIRRLNHGHSRKKPAGFVERALAEGRSVARRIRLVDRRGL